MDVARIHKDFPLLTRSENGRPLVYLDSAATSQKPEPVLAAERAFYEQRNANVRRGVYALSVEATEAWEAARAHVARFLHARHANEIVFLRGTTEALNLLATSLGRSVLKKGDRVVTTVMEHHSNIVPWHFLREYSGIDLEFADIEDNGTLRLADLDRWLDRKTKVVTLTHVSNVLGTLNPVREIADRAHAVGALVILDAAQSAPHLPLDVEKLGVDFLAFSGHKVLGPMGIGALWGRAELLERLPPSMGGGEMIREVHQDRVSYAEVPAKFEGGTPNVAGAIGLSAALEYLEHVGWEELRDHEQRLQAAAFRLGRERLGPGFRIVGPPDPRDRHAVLSFELSGVHPHDMASLLDARGICVRAGHHCAQPLMDRLHVPALARASPYLYNTEAELELLFDALADIARLFSPRATAPTTGS